MKTCANCGYDIVPEPNPTSGEPDWIHDSSPRYFMCRLVDRDGDWDYDTYATNKEGS